MKMRKLFAGVAAVATLLGGMAFGAAANAAGDEVMTVAAVPDGTTVTLKGENVTAAGDEFRADSDDTNKYTGQQGETLRQFAYLKLANYTKDSNDEYYLTSALTQEQLDKLAGAFQALGYDANGPIKDPFTWLGSQDASKTAEEKATAWRTFIDTVNTQLGTSATNFGSETDAGKKTTESLAGDNLTLDLKDQGLFMIIDKSGDYTVNTGNCPVTYHQIKPILLGTKLNNVTNGEGTITVSLGKGGASNVKQEQTTECTTNGGFEKTDAKGNALAGAEFTIYEWTSKDNPTEDAFTPDNLANLTQVGDPVTSDANGQVALNNLVPGKNYLVVETKVPTGYLAQYAAKLYVTVSGDPTDPQSVPTITIVDIANTGLLTGAVGAYKYKNITSITELPKTGAAGIAMFTVIGLLLAGAAGTVYLRSRRTKAMLNA